MCHWFKKENVVMATLVLLTGVLSAYPAIAQQDAAPEAPVSIEKPLTLDDYLNRSGEPSQETLSSSSAPTAAEQKQSAIDRLGNAIQSVREDADNPAQENGEGGGGKDALPSFKSKEKYEFEMYGFGDNAMSRDKVQIQAIDGALLEADPESEQVLVEEIRREAYDAAITGLFPLNREQIRSLIGTYDDTKRAVQEPVHGIPTPKVNVATLALDPGVAPLVIKTAVGHVTTLNILDITGSPWPIQDVTWAGNFEVTEPEEGGHILRVVPLAEAAYGNMSIRLLTLKTPITIALQTSVDEVQYRVDARIPEYGPFAQVPIIQGGMERVAGNAVITSLLDGVAPQNAERLDVAGADGRTTAYNYNGLTYVRTPLALLSPGWEQSVSSADGMNVYAMNETPIVLLSDNGQFLRVSLDSPKGSYDEQQ